MPHEFDDSLEDARQADAVDPTPEQAAFMNNSRARALLEALAGYAASTGRQVFVDDIGGRAVLRGQVLIDDAGGLHERGDANNTVAVRTLDGLRVKTLQSVAQSLVEFAHNGFECDIFPGLKGVDPAVQTNIFNAVVAPDGSCQVVLSASGTAEAECAGSADFDARTGNKSVRRLLSYLRRTRVRKVHLFQQGGSDNVDGMQIFCRFDDGIQASESTVSRIEEQLDGVIARIYDEEVGVRFWNDAGGVLRAEIDVPARSLHLEVCRSEYVNAEITMGGRVQMATVARKRPRARSDT